MFSQAEMLAGYSASHRAPFNEKIFNKSEDDIIYHLYDVITSSQRDKFFTIKVTSFRVIDDYREIDRILYDLESRRKNRRIKYNRLDYIDLKDSYIKLVEVGYYLAAEEGRSTNIKVYIAVPRIVDKYYFKIAGNLYSPMYQIVDGSTYNNSGSNNKNADPMVAFKPAFMKSVVYQKRFRLTTYDKKVYNAQCFVSDIFSSKIHAIKYILAKYGYYGTLSYLRLSDIYVTRHPILNKDWYCFEKNGAYISVPKYLFENNKVLQSLVCTVYGTIKDASDVDRIFNNVYWKEALGAEYKARNSLKGEMVLDSIEHIYNNHLRKILRLPMEQKIDMYSILRWVMYEHKANMAKDNTDISIKRIRFGEYIAIHYASRLVQNIFRVSNPSNKITLEKLINIVSINYNFLLGKVAKDNIIPYKNSVNDSDALLALKYTYKGVAGIGENNSSAVPARYRLVNASHIGRVDKDSSSNSDPGMGGTLCPYIDICEDGALSDFREPNTWQDVVDDMLSCYRSMNNMRGLSEASEVLLGTDESEAKARLNANIEHVARIMAPCINGNSGISSQFSVGC